MNMYWAELVGLKAMHWPLRGVVMIRALLAICILFVPTLGRGCECPYDDVDVESLKAAKHVFVFRVIRSSIDRSPKGRYRFFGDIEVVDTLRGNPRVFRRLVGSYGSCCGMRIVPGLYYFAFTSDDGPVFSANKANVLEPFAMDYEPGQRWGYFSDVMAMLNGTGGVDERHWCYSKHALAVVQHTRCFSKETQ